MVQVAAFAIVKRQRELQVSLDSNVMSRTLAGNTTAADPSSCNVAEYPRGTGTLPGDAPYLYFLDNYPEVSINSTAHQRRKGFVGLLANLKTSL